VRDADVNARPVVKADALKLLVTFRGHFQLPFMLEQVPLLIRHLTSEHVVVQTYAAMCLEKFLLVKDKGADGTGKEPKLTKAHLQPHLEGLFSGLFAVLENDELPENDYVMKGGKYNTLTYMPIDPQISPSP